MLERGLAELGVVDAGNHDHSGVRPRRPQLLQEAVARIVGQADVEQGDGILLCGEQAPCFRRGQGDVALKTPAAEDTRHDPGERFVVIHHQDAFGGCRSGHGHAV